MPVKNVALGWLMIIAVAGLLPVTSQAQAPTASRSSAPARAAPRPEDLDPGVDTSADEHRSSVAASAASPASAADPAPASSAPARTAASATRAKPGKPGTKPAAAAVATSRTEDHLQLDATNITGNRELPKVMVIVPWKRADLGDLAGKPMNSLVDEVLQPIDRDVFQRQTRYYDALKPDAAPASGSAASSTGAAPSPGSGGRH
jgi:hypothetical protein